MSNMSYCRFRNTLGDLQECFESLDGQLEHESIEELTHEELRAARELLTLCEEMLQFEDRLNK